MVGIDNSVKVAKLISDLNSTIENLKDENRVLKGTIDGEKRTTKLLKDELDSAWYERDKNRELADNYAAEAYEWQKKYYHEKEKHEKATKKITELQHDLETKAADNTDLKKEINRLNRDLGYKRYYRSINRYTINHYNAPKHAKKKDISEDKEEILDRCDFIDSEVKAWWNNRISTEEFKDAVHDMAEDIKELARPYGYISFNVISISNTILNELTFFGVSETTVKDIQECVDKIRQTVKEVM